MTAKQKPTTLYRVVEHIDGRIMDTIRKNLTTSYLSSRPTHEHIRARLDSVQLSEELLAVKSSPGTVSVTKLHQQKVPGSAPHRKPNLQIRIKRSQSSDKSNSRRFKYKDSGFEVMDMASQKAAERLLALRQQWTDSGSSSKGLVPKLGGTKDVEDIKIINRVIDSSMKRLTKPLHESMVVKIMKDGRTNSNIDRALSHYQANRKFYETKLLHNEEVSPEIKDLKQKQARILQEAKNNHKSVENLKVSPPEWGIHHFINPQNDELARKFQLLTEYGKPDDRHLKPVNHMEQLHKLKLENGTILETSNFWKWINSKNKQLVKVSGHQRDLNQDEKKLRRIINMADYVGYK